MSYSVSQAEEKDWKPLKNIIFRLQHYSFPSTRNIPQSRYEEIVRRALENLEVRGRMDSNFFPLCLWDESKRELVGYCLLDLGERNPIFLFRQPYILDFGIAEDHWGKFLWRFLLNKAFGLARDAGHFAVGGTITAENLRSLETFVRFAGIKTAGVQWVADASGSCNKDDGEVEIHVESSNQDAIQKAFPLIEENYRFRFQDYLVEFQSHMKTLQNAWIYEIKQLFKLEKVMLITGKIKGLESYAILDLGQIEPATGERQGVILDILLEKHAWKQGVLGRILEKAQQICMEAEIRYLVVPLPEGYRAFMEQLGYQAERYHVIKFLHRKEERTG